MATPGEIFDRIGDNIAENPEEAKKANAVFQFEIDGDNGGTWVVDVREDAEPPFVSEGDSDDSECVIKMTEDDWVGITSGDTNPMQAFMMGKIKVEGDMGLAMKLQNVLSMAN
jgi:putative sterol carrier protein